MFDHQMTWIEGFRQHLLNAAVFDEIWAGIPPYPNCCHCGEVNQQSTEWSGKEICNFSHIINPVLPAVKHNPLRHHQVIFHSALICVRSLVYRIIVVQYRTHTMETLNNLADYLEELHATKDVFTTYWMSKATDSITNTHKKDMKMQL
jgi:hypothetical protein